MRLENWQESLADAQVRVKLKPVSASSFSCLAQALAGAGRRPEAAEAQKLADSLELLESAPGDAATKECVGRSFAATLVLPEFCIDGSGEREVRRNDLADSQVTPLLYDVSACCFSSSPRALAALCSDGLCPSRIEGICACTSALRLPACVRSRFASADAREDDLDAQTSRLAVSNETSKPREAAATHAARGGRQESPAPGLRILRPYKAPSLAAFPSSYTM